MIQRYLSQTPPFHTQSYTNHIRSVTKFNSTLSHSSPQLSSKEYYNILNKPIEVHRKVQPHLTAMFSQLFFTKMDEKKKFNLILSQISPQGFLNKLA
jgi:hypothetical protein